MDNLEPLMQPLRALLAQLAVLLPRLGGALVAVLVGWALARLARFAVARTLRAFNFQVVAERAGLDGLLRQAGLQSDTAAIVAGLAFWTLLAAALVVAADTLGLVLVTALLRDLTLFLLRLALVVFIVVFGAYFARVVGEASTTFLRNAGVADPVPLGQLARYAVVGFVMLIALDQLELRNDLVRLSFLVVLAGVVLAFAIAFGLGGRAWARDLIERWWWRAQRPEPPARTGTGTPGKKPTDRDAPLP